MFVTSCVAAAQFDCESSTLETFCTSYKLASAADSGEDDAH